MRTTGSLVLIFTFGWGLRGPVYFGFNLWTGDDALLYMLVSSLDGGRRDYMLSLTLGVGSTADYGGVPCMMILAFEQRTTAGSLTCRFELVGGEQQGNTEFLTSYMILAGAHVVSYDIILTSYDIM